MDAFVVELKERTWAALQSLSLDSNDRESVLRYEKLAKLHLSLTRYLEKQSEKKPVKIEKRKLEV